jgi:hypothetical protein
MCFKSRQEGEMKMDLYAGNAVLGVMEILNGSADWNFTLELSPLNPSMEITSAINEYLVENFGKVRRCDLGGREIAPPSSYRISLTPLGDNWESKLKEVLRGWFFLVPKKPITTDRLRQDCIIGLFIKSIEDNFPPFVINEINMPSSEEPFLQWKGLLLSSETQSCILSLYLCG